MVGQLSAVKGAGELGGVRDYGGGWGSEGEMDQYTSQFLMRERIGPSQADGSPALPGVVFLHRLSAGYQIFRAALCSSAPTGERLLWQRLREIQIFTFITFPAFTQHFSHA